MVDVRDFRPDWASAPGDTITDILNQRGISVADFAQQIGQSLKDAHDLLQGRAAITLGTARQLEHVLGASVAFWMSRDFQYREDAAELRTAEKNWLAALPIRDMIRFGWLDSVPRPSDELGACLRFFNVPDLRTWRESYKSVLQQAAFKTSASFDSRPESAAVWLRQGELVAESIPCRPWNPHALRESLPALRELTRKKHPSAFVLDLQQRCSESGVALAIVRSPNGCRASGATRFVSRDRALLLLSFRHLSDDHFWFAFFHEIGHLLLHGSKEVFVEGTGSPSTNEEREADDFAARTLVPPEFVPMLMTLPTETRAVIRFASLLGVSPGILVGQLQHRGRIPHSHLNGLKRRFEWITSPSD